MDMQDIDFTSPAMTPPQTPRRPLTPGLSSGGALVLEGLVSYRRSQLSPIVTERCLSASPTFSVVPPTPAPPTSRNSFSQARITPGTYVAFALATPLIAEQFYPESTTHTQVRDFDRTRFLGLVSDSFTYMTAEGEMVNEIIVHHVSRLSPSPGAVEHHHIPIYPTADTGNSRGSPLRTMTLFPFVDCKQWTALGVKLTADVIHESTLVFALPDDEFLRFEDLAVTDYREQRLLKSCICEAEGDELRILDAAQYTLPAEIWKDIRIGHESSDPMKFLEEVRRLENIISEYPTGNSPSPTAEMSSFFEEGESQT